MTQPRYAEYTQWGIYVADRETGEVVSDFNSIQRYVPGSTTKLFPAAVVLTAYGPEFRFQTPVYRRGDVVDGALDGDLILVASGDITMGGRDQPDGTLAHGNIDHTDTNAVPGVAMLTDLSPGRSRRTCQASRGCGDHDGEGRHHRCSSLEPDAER